MGYSIERLKDGISDAERNIAEMTRVIGVERERIATHRKLITEALVEAEKEAAGEVDE